MSNQTDVQVQKIRAIGLTVTNYVDAEWLVGEHHLFLGIDRSAIAIALLV